MATGTVVPGVSATDGLSKVALAAAVLQPALPVAFQGQPRGRGAAAAVIGRAEFTAQALAPHHVSGGILVLHVRRAEVAQINLTRGVNAVRGSGVIKLDRYREIEGIHQANVIVVAASGGTRQCELSKGGSPGSGMCALQLAAVTRRA